MLFLEFLLALLVIAMTVVGMLKYQSESRRARTEVSARKKKKSKKEEEPHAEESREETAEDRSLEHDSQRGQGK